MRQLFHGFNKSINRLLKAVFKSQSLNLEKKHTDHPIRKGVLTALLNPKGMLIYFAILPQFMTQTGNTVVQGFILSYIFIGLIFVVYCSLSLIFAKISQKHRWMHIDKNASMVFREHC